MALNLPVDMPQYVVDVLDLYLNARRSRDRMDEIRRALKKDDDNEILLHNLRKLSMKIMPEDIKKDALLVHYSLGQEFNVEHIKAIAFRIFIYNKILEIDDLDDETTEFFKELRSDIRKLNLWKDLEKDYRKALLEEVSELCSLDSQSDYDTSLFGRIEMELPEEEIDID